MCSRILIALALASSLLPAGAGTAAAAPARPEVLAFQTQGSPPALIDGSAPALTSVGVAGVSLSGPGAVSAVDPSALAQLKAVPVI